MQDKEKTIVSNIINERMPTVFRIKKFSSIVLLTILLVSIVLGLSASNYTESKNIKAGDINVVLDNNWKQQDDNVYKLIVDKKMLAMLVIKIQSNSNKYKSSAIKESFKNDVITSGDSVDVNDFQTKKYNFTSFLITSSENSNLYNNTFMYIGNENITLLSFIYTNNYCADYVYKVLDNVT